MFLPFYFHRCRILHFWIYSCFRSICHPLSNEYFILLCEKVWSLTLPLIVDPMPFEMISTPLCHDSVATTHSDEPHSLIYVPVWVNHSTLSMGFVIHPHSIISVTCFVEHCSSTFLEVIFPVPCVFPSKLIFGITNPEGSLAMPFIILPTSLVLIAIFIVLYSKTIFFVVIPIADIFLGACPFVRLFRSIFVKGLFLDKGGVTLTQ